jgi:hypothetical protein
MEEFLVAILCFAVIGLSIKLSRLADASAAIAELIDLTRRLEQRLTNLERQISRQAATPVAAEQKPAPPAPQPAPSIPAPAAAHQELKVSQADFVVPATIKPAAIPVAPAPVHAAPPPLPPRPIPPSQPTQSVTARSISIEERLGQNWLSKIGIVLVVLGVATFLGYKLVTLGPLGKSLTGLATALILLLGGLFLERKPNYRIFARAGIGGGWALLFFVSFALYHVDAMRVLTSQGTDLILMALVASAMVWHSLRYKSQVITALAFLLAFATVGISHVTLFSLVAGAILAASLVYIAAREYWFELGLAGLCGVYINHFIWLLRVLPDGGQIGHPFPEFFASAVLLLLYWFIFRLFYILRVPQDRHQELIASLTAILNSVGLLALLKYQSSHPEWAFRALLVLGTVEFALAFVARTRWRTAFLVLSTLASALLLAAIPFRFAGSNWTLLWLFEAEALFIAGVLIHERALRRLGLIAGFLTALQLLFVGTLPVLGLRLLTVDTSSHTATAISLVTAALLFWFNSEYARRRWSEISEEVFDEAALTLTSYIAAVSLAGALWLWAPESWTIVAWLAAALAIGFAADKLASSDLATQADILATSAVVRAVVINLGETTHWGMFTLRAITVTLAAALLYAAMFRKTRGVQLPSTDYVATAYSWAASVLLALLCWYELQPVAIAISWGILGLVLFELGTIFRRSYFRAQAYSLFAASFVRIFLYDLNFDLFGGIPYNAAHGADHHIYTVIPLIATYIWIYHRTQTALAESPSDRTAGVIAAWLGTTAATTLLYLEFRPEFITIGWSLLALVLIIVAWLLRRPIFTAQALTLLLVSAARALVFNLFIPADPATSFWSTRAATISVASAVMLLCLPMAFAIRRSRLALEVSTEASEAAQDSWHLILTHPEQPFFFVPFALIAVLIAFELRTGMITLGWIALGLTAFLAALPIGERSYRLSGLSLLLFGLAKIVLVDIWSLSTTDRILTLIVTGIALLLVSFLYSRYRETILKFL